MGLKEKLENNIIIILVGVVITTTGITFGVNQYFVGQKTDLLKTEHDQDIRELESKLASIQRGISDNYFLDVRTFQLKGEDYPSSAIPTDSEFFSEDSFYAIRSLENWKYSKTSEAELVATLIGEELPEQYSKLARTMPIHLWRGNDELEIKGHDSFVKMFPYALIQKIPYSKLGTLVGAGINFLEEDELPLEEDETVQDLIADFEDLFRGDALGTLFTLLLNAQLAGALMSPQTEFRIVTIQKVGNVLYAHMLITLKDLEVNGVFYDKYYIRNNIRENLRKINQGEEKWERNGSLK